MRSIPTLDNTDASTLMTAARAALAEAGLTGAIAIVDAAGVVLEVHRHHLAKPHMGDFAIRKARTAALLGLPTQILEQMAAQGRPMSPETLALAGGVPIMAQGVAAGGVGISGGASEMDHRIALEAVSALSASPA